MPKGGNQAYARLMQCYQATMQGRAYLVVIDGKAGMGKTRLAEQFVRRVQAQGTDLLIGRAFDTGQPAYGPLIDAIRPRLERERALDDLLADVWLYANRRRASEALQQGGQE
jgi:predicted ATPase